MKIPIYQTQIPYQRAVARPVTLTAPMQEYVHLKSKKGWMKVGEFLEKKDQLEEWLTKKKKERAEAAQAISAAPVSSESEKRPGCGREKELVPMDFSHPLRKSLLDFSRAQTQLQTSFSDDHTSVTGIAKLDEYVSSQEKAETASNPALWKDDYVILRQEMKHLQRQYSQQQAKENFEQGASSFIQTAALVRNPDALESYIQNNLSAAGLEAEEQGISTQEWSKQKDFLYRQAVSHNIESALAGGELDNAQAMYKHFHEKLPADTQQLLSAKLQVKQADIVAQHMCQNLPEIVSAQDSSNIRQQIQDQYGETEFGKQIQQAAAVHLQKRNQDYWQRRASAYGSCFSANSAESIPVQNSSDFEEIVKLKQAFAQAPQMQSIPAVFNQLYAHIRQGYKAMPAIEQAFDNHELNAADCARLKQAYCLHQAQKQDPKAAIVPLVVSRLCRECHLTDDESEQTYYFVLSAGNSAQEQLQAARDVKQMLLLQEKNK